MTREEMIKELKTVYLGDSIKMREAKNMAIKALEQEPCDDAISRQVVIDAIDDDNRNGHYSCFATNNDAECFKQIIRDLPSATPQPCGDCISREEALKALMDEWTEFDSELIDYLIEKIDKLPSVTPHQKMGHWEKDEYGNIHCTFCGCNALYEKIHYPDDYFGKVVRAKSGFCPTCGAKMQEVRYGE